MNYLKGNTSHPSAEDIFKSVQGQFPTMSFATVYNTLDALRKKGSIQELKIDSGKKRYDPDCSRHHHLICNKCKNIVDIFKDFELNLSDDYTEGYELLGNSIEFFGICHDCQQIDSQI